MIEVHCSCLAATHTGSEALGRSKDICLTQCAPVHTAHYPVLSAPNAHPETSAGSVPACTCPSPAPALPLHSIQPPAICMHAQLNLPSSCKNLAHLGARLVSQHDLGYPSHYPGSSSLSLSKPIKCPCHLSHPPALAAETEKAKSMF